MSIRTPTHSQMLKFATRTFTRSLSQFKKQPQLYLHPEDGKYLVSFSKDPNKLYLGKAKLFADQPEEDDISPENFEENPKFRDLLHKVVAEHVADDFTYLVESKDFSGDHMAIYDLRKIPNYQRIPEIEDTFGFVNVDEKGNVVEGSYQKNDLYRLVETGSGPIKLSDHLHEKLLEYL